MSIRKNLKVIDDFVGVDKGGAQLDTLGPIKALSRIRNCTFHPKETGIQAWNRPSQDKDDLANTGRPRKRGGGVFASRRWERPWNSIEFTTRALSG